MNSAKRGLEDDDDGPGLPLKYLRMSPPTAIAIPPTKNRALRPQVLTGELLDAQKVNTYLDTKYNRSLQFARHLPEDSIARQKAAEVQESVRTLERIFRRASQEVDLHTKALADNVQAFMDAVTQTSENWYAEGDLTELVFSDLRAKLRTYPITNTKAYYEYLCRILPTAALSIPLLHEETNDRKKPDQLPINFVDKVMHLVAEIRNMPNGRYYAFHGYALLATKVLRPDRLRCKASKLPSSEIVSMLEELAARPGGSQGESELVKLEVCPDYFDFAAPARDMCAAMRERCLGGRVNTYCHHFYDLLAVGFLQPRAYGEIRAKVFLTAGTRLPVELTELVFEYAMAAESMPLVPKPGLISRQERLNLIARGVLTEDEEPCEHEQPYFVCEKMASMLSR